MCVIVDVTDGVIGMPPSVWAKELAMDGERHGKPCVTRIGVIDNDVWSCRAIATSLPWTYPVLPATLMLACGCTALVPMAARGH